MDSLYFAISVAGGIQHLPQAVELLAEIIGMIAGEEPMIVRDIGVLDLANALVIVVAHHIVAQEIAAGDDAVADIGFLQRIEHALPVEAVCRVENDRKAEAR